MTHDRRVLLMALGAGFPAVVVSLLLLWAGDYTPKVQWTIGLFISLLWIGFAFALRQRVVFPLQTLSNLLAALREDDFSIRARGARSDDPLGEVIREVNALADTLREQRLGAVEATALLHTVMAEIDVAVFAFDAGERLRLVNRAGERLLGRPAGQILTRTAAELGLADYVRGETPRILNVAFPGGAGQWELRRTRFRQGGLPHELMVLADVSRPLREQERQAWQRLIRVIGHELNNSLAPITSIVGSLETLLARDPPPADWQDDTRRGLTVIASRAEALTRFTTAYARMARLPPPRFHPVALDALVRRVVSLETRAPVRVGGGPDVRLEADSDQLEQLLINLLRNAVDATLETGGGGVEIGWRHADGRVEIAVVDEGPGLSNTANLFVPFFTTKANGSGIGLVLGRQIAESHHGTLTLENRRDARGCRGVVSLPIMQASLP